MATGLDLGRVGWHMLAATTTERDGPRRDANLNQGPDHEEEETFPMDTQQGIAPPCAPPGSPGTRPDVTPTSGVLHVNTAEEVVAEDH